MIVVAATGVMTCVLVRCALSLRRRAWQNLGLLPVAIVVFGFLYVVQPLYLILTDRMGVFLTDRQVAKGMLVAALMLVFLAWGWSKGGGSAGRARLGLRAIPRWQPRRLWNFGLGAAIVGTVMFMLFLIRSGGLEAAFSGMHGAAMAWTENTAYLYLSPWWVLSGGAMMILAACRLKRCWLNRWLPAGFAGLMYAYAVLTASRGWFFATTMTVIVAHRLRRSSQVSAPRAFAYVGVACLGVLLVLGYRSVLHLGEEKPSAPPLRDALTAAMAVDEGHARQRTTGVEFIFHAAVLDTVDQTRKYHFGINWLYVYTVHLIPRILWPEKPYGFNSPGITWDDIAAVTGVRVAGGAAPGIVADIYWHFGPLSPLFFFALGFLTRRLYSAARTLQSALATVSYVMLYALSLNAFAQGFGAILVPLPYSIAPVVLWWWTERRASKRVAGYVGFRVPMAQARPCRLSGIES